MKLIPLTRGFMAKVDDDDYVRLSKYKWYCSTFGYAVRNSENRGTMIWMHRVILNTPDGMDTDHRNLDRLDNQKCNLRVCTRSQNRMNQKAHVDSKSGFKGVYYHRSSGKYMARIQANKKEMFLGEFSTPDLASLAYQSAATQLHGEFARI